MRVRRAADGRSEGAVYRAAAPSRTRPRPPDASPTYRRGGSSTRGRSGGPPFRRAILALSGGPTDARIVQLACALAKSRKAELVGVHVVEIDWTLPLDADIAGRSEEASAHPRHRRGDGGAGAYGSSRCCCRPATSGRPSSTRPPSAAPTCCYRPAVPAAVRGRFRHRAHHPLCPEERAVRGLGRARTHARGGR